MEIGWTHDLLLKARLDQSSVLDSNVEICEMFSGHSSNCRTSEERQRVLCVGYREGREVARATSLNQRRFETRSLPALSRSYPRHFTFHVAHPIHSIDSLVPTRLICYPRRLDRPSRSFPRLDSPNCAGFEEIALPGLTIMISPGRSWRWFRAGLLAADSGIRAPALYEGDGQTEKKVTS